MANDLRTQYETSDVENVLNGDLESFIEAELKLKNND
jgi:protein subunit release factor B